MKKRDLLLKAEPHYEEDQLLELDHAITLATKAHSGQRRKSGEPYIIHPIAVAATLISLGFRPAPGWSTGADRRCPRGLASTRR